MATATSIKVYKDACNDYFITMDFCNVLSKLIDFRAEVIIDRFDNEIVILMVNENVNG